MVTECLGCQRLEDPNTKLVKLHTGKKVCNYCPEWMLETEALEFLDKPLKDRQKALNKYQEMSPKHTAKLKERMTEIFNYRKLLKKDQLSL